MTQPNLYLCILLVLFGILFHFVLKLSELESQGKIVTPWAYWARAPLYEPRRCDGRLPVPDGLALHERVDLCAALLIGIACNSIGDKLRARAEAAIQ
jgi:hypothetical protein